jgi:hypothetical protein
MTLKGAKMSFDVDMTEGDHVPPAYEAAYVRILRLLRDYDSHVKAFLVSTPEAIAGNWKLKALKATNRELKALTGMYNNEPEFRKYLRDRLEFHYPGKTEKLFSIFLI